MILKTFYILCISMRTVLCLFDQCNHRVNMKPGEKLYVNSPYYPGDYPVGSSCRYVIRAPEDYQLKFKCNIKLNTPAATTTCLTEIFYFNREGTELLTGSEYFCGTGKMERKSFLNQVVISYISTPHYNRILTNAIKEGEEELEMNQNTTETPTKMLAQTKTTTTSKPLKESHLGTTTTIITTRKTTPIPVTSTLATTPSSPATFSSSIDSSSNEYKNVSNSFAYVVALLSNKIDIKTMPTKTTTTTTPQSTAAHLYTLPPMVLAAAAAEAEAVRPTSVLKFYDFLPANTWRNGSIAMHKISSKRVSKVIVGQDFINSQQQQPLQSTSSFSAEGGGSFSCLVEVVEPQCECGWSSTVKIAGASGVAGINEYPSMAGVMTIKNQKIFCGATIIHHRYLLSAAHCYITPETSRSAYLRAVVGEHDLSTVLESTYTRQYKILDIIIHEHFRTTSSNVQNDIALLKTIYPIEWNRSVGPVCLPFYTLTGLYGVHTTPFIGQRVETAGWGTTSFGGQQSSVLLKTILDVISRAQCENIIRTLPSGVFCTYTPGRDSCQYDSGGALYERRERLYAVGIVSYGFTCASNQPSVNARVASHLKWLRSKTPEVKYCWK